jgi:hypothetical protein
MFDMVSLVSLKNSTQKVWLESPCGLEWTRKCNKIRGNWEKWKAGKKTPQKGEGEKKGHSRILEGMWGKEDWRTEGHGKSWKMRRRRRGKNLGWEEEKWPGVMNYFWWPPDKWGQKHKKWGKLRKKFRQRRRTDWRQEKNGKNWAEGIEGGGNGNGKWRSNRKVLERGGWP